MAEIYVIRFPNGKCYVGRTKTTSENRFRRHFRSAIRGSSYAVHSAIRKYSAEVRLETLESGLSWGESGDRERLWIAKLNTLSPHGYNLTSGGDGVNDLSDESRMKIVASRRKRQTRSETRNRSADAMKQRWHTDEEFARRMREEVIPDAQRSGARSFCQRYMNDEAFRKEQLARLNRGRNRKRLESHVPSAGGRDKVSATIQENKHE